jgi:hypothetical protein
MKKYNPKALNIEKLRYTDKRVTLGFKCDPQVKIELAEKATVNNISLSEYVEEIVVNLPIKNANLREKVGELSERLSYYEDNPILARLLEREAGKEYEIQSSDNKTLKIMITEVKDVFDVMVNSFKFK